MTSPRLSTEQRQALELLAKYPHGAAEELFVFVHRFNRDTIAGLVQEGLFFDLCWDGNGRTRSPGPAL